MWGGDCPVDDKDGNIGVKGIGQTFYTAILAHFGHTHILNVHSKINAKIQNLCADTLSQDLVIEHLAHGGTQIFNWYAQLVSYPSGCKIPYPDPTNTNPAPPPYANLKGLIDMYINETNTPVDIKTGEPTGHLSVAYIVNELKKFVAFLYTGDLENYIAVPKRIIDAITGDYYGLEQFLRNILRMDCNNPVQFLAWDQLKIHFIYVQNKNSTFIDNNYIDK
jgi:hypothetical protein